MKKITFKIKKMKQPTGTKRLKEGKTFYRVLTASGEYTQDFKTKKQALNYKKKLEKVI